LGVTVLQACTKAKIVELFAVAAAGDDVDGAGNGAGTGLGGGCAQDFNALDLLRREFVQREAARRRLAVDQDLV
jgi:hypothetical protein